MKVTKVMKHGKTRWRVNNPHGPNGKRQRRFFDSQAAAERWARERTKDQHSFGIHVAEMASQDRAALGYHLQRLKDAGWNLAAAVDFVLEHGRNPPSVSLANVVKEFLTAKRAGGLRRCYLRKLDASIHRFARGRENQPIAQITPVEIQEYISCNGWKPATMRSYLVDVKTLFSFAVKRKFLRENTADAVDLPRLDDKPPGILTPAETRAVLESCVDHEPDALAVLVLCLFAGLRRAEAERLDWSEISPEFIEVKAHKAKTRRRRLVSVSPQLRRWLDCARAVGAQLPAANYAGKLTRILEKAGLRDNWPQNALRHAFASYHLAKHRNENETASLMGSSPQMVFQHYREMVRPGEADEFFALLPPVDSKTRADSIRASRRAKVRRPPPKQRKVTLDHIAAVFDGGRVRASRKDAVFALMIACDCSKPSAYNALSPRGRFAAHLEEDSEGLMTWRPATLPGASLAAAATLPEVASPTGG